MNDTRRQTKRPEKLSVVIPARDEARDIGSTVEHLAVELRQNGIPHEIIVVDDGSKDDTLDVLKRLSASIPTLRVVENRGRHGFGMAVVKGLNAMSGDAVAIFMGDGSDAFQDVTVYWEKLSEGYDCVFGSRFIKGSAIVDYPAHKLALNRLVNLFIRCLFRIRLNDTTNAFKAYRREVIDGCRPFLSPHFNLTVELPLKAIVRGYSWTVVPISWRNRKHGVSKLRIREMGSRYLFIVLYIWLERMFVSADYSRDTQNGVDGQADTL